MQKDFNHYIKKKQRRQRFFTILIITILAASTAVLMQECNQNFDEPYNKGYQPMDGIQNSSTPRG
ncbi:MAG: hypothetical protein R8M46_00015 [Ghiorsea sp.]